MQLFCNKAWGRAAVDGIAPKFSKESIGGESMMCYATHYHSHAPGKNPTLRGNDPEFKRLCHPKGHDRLEAAPGPTADFSSVDLFHR